MECKAEWERAILARLKSKSNDDAVIMLLFQKEVELEKKYWNARNECAQAMKEEQQKISILNS